MNFSTLCTILVTFGPETPEFTLLTIPPFCSDTAKIGLSRQLSQRILDLPRPTLQVWLGVLVGIMRQVFVWQSPKGRCYGNQLNIGDVRKRQVE